MRTLARFAFPSVFFLLSLLSARSQPKLDIEGGPQFDFGDMYDGAVVTRDLKLRNAGTDTLLVFDVSAGCGCTGTMISTGRIAAGESGTLSISFDSRGQAEHALKVVTFNTNDSAHGHVRITFTAHVIKSLTLNPEYLVFKTNADSAVTAEVDIYNMGSDPVKIISAKSTSDILEVSLAGHKVSPGDEMKLKCTLSPKMEGLTRGTITIKTDRPMVPEINVRFFAQVGPRSHTN